MATSVASHGAPSGDHSEADTIEPSDSKVHVLTYRNFDRFVKRNPLILMEFYAPWCGHCQELAPQYRAAASKLAKADLPIPVVLAKMNDGDEANRRLRAGAPEMFNYSSYPSLFVIKDGKYGGGFPSMGNETRCKELGYCGEHEWYGGGRVADEIVFHMSAVARGLDPYDEEKKTRPGNVVLFFVFYFLFFVFCFRKSCVDDQKILIPSSSSSWYSLGHQNILYLLYCPPLTSLPMHSCTTTLFFFFFLINKRRLVQT